MWQILVYFAEFCKRVKHKPIDENESSAHYQGLTAELAVLRAQGKKVDWFLQWVLYMRDMHLW